MSKKLPLIELGVSDIDSPQPAVTRTALVDSPAIMENWMIFSGDKPYQFKTVSEERRLVMGPAMIPDLEIYRNDEFGEYNVVFRKPTVEKIMKKIGKEGNFNSFNINHVETQVPDGVYLFEIFMIDSERGIKTPEIFKKEFNDGTMMMTLFIENETIWQDYIKTGKLIGFSVEGFFSHLFKAQSKPVEQREESDDEKALNIAIQELTKVL